MQDQLIKQLIALADEEYCYLTTTGRISGRPHEIEIWFGVRDNRIYLMSGSRSSDWLKNLRKDPAVTVRIDGIVFSGTASLVADSEEEMTARYILAEKYQEWEEGKNLSEWARTAIVVAIELNSFQGT